MDQKTLHRVEQLLGHQFRDKSILSHALTHASSVDSRLESNERLEFLGDAVLSLVICESLFDTFENYLEGDLTKVKSMLVSRETCAQLTNEMDLHQYLQVGKGMLTSRSLSRSLAAGLLEALIAALYLDGGLETARAFILNLYDSMIQQADAQKTQGNYKSVLQHYVQEHFGNSPTYVLLDEKGPDHDKAFELAVVIEDRHFPSAWGNNKKEAEQKAAYNALIELGVTMTPRSAGRRKGKSAAVPASLGDEIGESEQGQSGSEHEDQD